MGHVDSVIAPWAIVDLVIAPLFMSFVVAMRIFILRLVFRRDGHGFGLLQQAPYSYFIDDACGRPGVMMFK